MSHYCNLIVKTTGCEPGTAPMVEEFMRVERPTLDALDQRQFGALARTAYAAAVEVAKTGELAEIAEMYQMPLPAELRTCEGCQAGPGVKCSLTCSSNWK